MFEHLNSQNTKYQSNPTKMPNQKIILSTENYSKEKIQIIFFETEAIATFKSSTVDQLFSFTQLSVQTRHGVV